MWDLLRWDVGFVEMGWLMIISTNRFREAGFCDDSFKELSTRCKLNDQVEFVSRLKNLDKFDDVRMLNPSQYIQLRLTHLAGSSLVDDFDGIWLLAHPVFHPHHFAVGSFTNESLNIILYHHPFVKFAPVSWVVSVAGRWLWRNRIV